MNRLGSRRVFGCIVCALALCGTVLFHRTASAAQTSTDIWRPVRGQQLSSVAWSPDGSTIAFVATERSPVWTPSTGTREQSESQPSPHLKSADIWLLRLDSVRQPLSLKRFLTPTAKTGIPTALFWVSDREIAWAADASADKEGFSFLYADISADWINPLAYIEVRIQQMRTHYGPSTPGPWCPDDVYWDAKGRKLVFSGSLTESLHNSIWTYDLGSGKLKKVDMADVHGYPQCVTFCGIPGSKSTPLYFAGLRWPDDPRYEASDYGLWTTTSAAATIDARNCRPVVSKREGLYFPRLSSIGRLAWIQTEGTRNGDSSVGMSGYYLMIQDAANNGKAQRIALPGDLGDHTEVDPYLGCPFSWSPNGQRIAYADGDSIKFLAVGTKQK